ncbi:MAG: YIP1 family protein [Elusimicrobiota bacterium]
MDIIYSLIIEPDVAIHRLVRKSLSYRSFWVLVAALLSQIVGFALFFTPPGQLFTFSITWGLLLRFIVSVFFLFILSTMYHYFAEMFGGAVKGNKIFKLIPFSFIPFCFITPVGLILKALMDTSGIIILMLILWVFIFLAARLQYKMISYIYGLSASKALSALILPWAMVLGITFVFPIFIVMSILTMFI